MMLWILAASCMSFCPDASQQAHARANAFEQVESKRANSLSIVNPMDVLRQKLLLDIVRRRMRQAKGQVAANREWLKTIGKRDYDQRTVPSLMQNTRLI